MAKRDFLVDIDLNKNQLLNFKLQNLATPPSLTINDKGYSFFDTTDGIQKTWTGTAWINVTGIGVTNLGISNTNIDVSLTSSTGTGVTINAATASFAGVMTAAMFTKLAGITAGADITNATTVNAAGAVMETDYDAFSILAANTDNVPVVVTLSPNTILGRIEGNIQAIAIDSDLTSTSAAHDTIPTAKATKDYVDNVLTGAMVYQSGYDAVTNLPDLDVSPSPSIKKGWTYTVTADGLFFSAPVAIGDVLIAEKDAPTLEVDWTIVNKNIPAGTTYKYATNITGTGLATSFTVTHNLNTTDIVTFLKEATTNAKVEAEEVITNVNVLTLNFNTAPANGKVYRITVIG